MNRIPGSDELELMGAERALPDFRAWPYGSRWEPDFGGGWTVVAYITTSSFLATPILLGDEEVADASQQLTFAHPNELSNVSGSGRVAPPDLRPEQYQEGLVRLPDDGENGELARAAINAANAYRNGARKTSLWDLGEPFVHARCVFWAPPETAQQIVRMHACADADRALAKAEAELHAASVHRARMWQRLAAHCGSQAQTARLLGKDPSRVQRTISSLPVEL